MIKSKKQMFIIISIFALILLLGTTTYAFFNYTRTGANNTISVGRINFITRQTETINLTNVFPIERSAIGTDTDNVDEVVIEIEGDTDYSGGIEYLVSSVDSSIYTSTGKLVPISLDVTVEDLGTASPTYFTSRDNTNTSIYKKLVGDTLVGDQMLLVGYIVPNDPVGTTDGIDGSITIKAFFDKDVIAISDTYDGTESDYNGTTNEWVDGRTVLTTTEWNNLNSNGVSFKIKVEANEGIWVIGSLEEIMKKTTVMDNIASTYVSSSSGIDFGVMSSDTNGKGVYTRAGTENDVYPIMYYRGDVEDNNVVFNNKCWKTVRTTDTGGVKLIYNGETKSIYDKVPLLENQYTVLTNQYTELTNTDGTNNDVWFFDSEDNSWNISITSMYFNLELSFNVPEGDGYVFEMTGQNGTSGSGGYNMYKGTSVLNGGSVGDSGSVFSLSYPYGELTADDVVKFTFIGGGYTSPITFKLKMLAPGDLINAHGCDNIVGDTYISLDGTTQFRFSGADMSNSPAYVGYMWGTVYPVSTANWISNAKFGSDFTWDGTNYKLVNATVSVSDSAHHYSCNSTNAEATCTELRYVYYGSYPQYHYVTLTGGDGIEEAITKMKTNTINSNAKDKVDTWYSSNMTGVTNKLEDTIWCNDRSFGDGNNNGWIANGGDLSTLLHYGAFQRSDFDNVTSTVKNQPSLVCVDKNDRFTVNNNEGNKALTYPVALLTEDEKVLAGGLGGIANGMASFYLGNGSYWWTMSPGEFSSDRPEVFYSIEYSGSIVTNGHGLRPSVSIKPGQLITQGTGTVTDPYVIE